MARPLYRVNARLSCCKGIVPRPEESVYSPLSAFVQLPVRRLDQFSNSPAVIRVDSYADAYTESGLIRITSQSSLDALRNLFGHPFV